MIISHKYKFIFLKTQKTAGTSIEIALSKFCGTDDIITPISPIEDEKFRENLGYPGPQNYLAPITDYRIPDILKWLKAGKRKYRFFNHMPAKEVKKLIGKKIWNNYYKFCFERNPWDRVISKYYWRFRNKQRPTLSTFIYSDKILTLKKRGFWLYTIDGEIAVDKVCRYEYINEELEKIRTMLGIPGKLELPDAKSGFRKDKRHYRDILNEEEKEKIAEIFNDEINLFGYEF